MAFLSEFELIASILEGDRFFMEIDEYGFGELLTKILRECHDHNNPKYDASDLADQIASHILQYVVSSELVIFPEEEGSGTTDWDAVDAEAKRPAAEAELKPSEYNVETGLYNPEPELPALSEDK